MQTTTLCSKKSLAIIAFLLLIFPSCQKDQQFRDTPNAENSSRKKPRNPPTPPPPPPFYFSDCSTPLYAATFFGGASANVVITKNYINSPGGSYPAFSSTVNGITFSTPAGTYNVGSGSITFTATGTPTVTGISSVWLNLGGGIIPCTINFTVTNAPASGPTVDPGPAIGSTGVVNFIYKGQSVAYTTVRAGDGKIWLQQNLGSPQVAFHEYDESSFGDYFQWGRWDDGHQSANSPTIPGNSSLVNPSHIPSGNPNFITGATSGSGWWGSGGLASDTWNGTTTTSTNGKDPCAALGAGWRLPTAAEWQNISIREDLFGILAAFDSNLKLPAAGNRYSNGGYVFANGDVGYYWTSTADANSKAKVFFYDNVYNAGVAATERGQGFPCRCLKD